MVSQALREASADPVTLQAARDAAPAGHEPAPGFEGWVRGRFVDGSEGGGPYPVWRVLERTAVLEVAAGDRRLARLDAVLVDPGQIEWQLASMGTPLGIKRWRGQVPQSRRDAVRERSDRWAIASQARDRVAGARGSGSRPLALTEANTADVAGVEQKEVAPPEGDPGSGRDAGLELLTTPGLATAIEGGPEVERQAGPRQCGRCGKALAGHNRGQLCTPCQLVCPDCGGRKSPRSQRCQRCRSAAPGAEPDAQSGRAIALRIASVLEQLPEELCELVARLVAALARQHEIEGELARCRAAERRIRRIDRRLRSAIAAGAEGDG